MSWRNATSPAPGEPAAPPRGLLRPAQGASKFGLRRLLPADDLARLVEHFSLVSWDLPSGESYQQETLPHAGIHLVIQAGQSRVSPDPPMSRW